MNLTEQQKDLLRLLVAKHESSGGAPFIFARSMNGAGVCYPDGDSVSVPNDDIDFHQLQREQLITLIPSGKNQWRGKPTERGITFVRNSFTPSTDTAVKQKVAEAGTIAIPHSQTGNGSVLPKRSDDKVPEKTKGGLEKEPVSVPELSESTRRKLAIQWDTVRDNQKLTEEDLSGYDRERRRLLGMPANPPSYVRPLRPHATARDVGVDPSVRAAEARFRGIDSEYWMLWCSSGFGYEVYRDWLDSVTRQISAELASIWKGRSDVTDCWFQSTCAPAIEKALEALVKLRIRQARDVEFRRIPAGTTTRFKEIVGRTMTETKDDLLRLPKGIESSDPVDGNPFPEGDVRHGFWDRATKEAEEEVCRLNDAFVRTRPSALEETMPFDMAYFTAKYDTWAKRGVRVVLARELIASWDQWLANYANETLKIFKVLSPPDVALQKLRDMLIGRREHWRAEAKRNVALQEAHQAQLAVSKSGVGVSGTIATPVAEDGSPKANEGGAKEPNGDESARAALGPAVAPCQTEVPRTTPEIAPPASVVTSQQDLPSSGPQRRNCKGDSTLLDGKRAVTFKTAEAYLGISERQRQNLTKTGALTIEGQGTNRKISTESLKKYLPSENPK